MDDSDDYFNDGFELNDDALAILDLEENKHNLSTEKTSASSTPPPPKRQKTDTGWKPAPVTRSVVPMDDLDDLPEISVKGDGSYGLHARHAAAASTRPNSASVGLRVNVASPATLDMPRSVKRTPITRTASSSSSSNAQKSRSPSVPPLPRPIVHRQPSLSAPKRTVSVPSPGSQGSTSNGTQSRTLPVPAQSHAVESDAIEMLRQQMEELRKDNERIQTVLQEAMDIRLAKEGEVSILRKNMEKTAQDHSAQVAKLKLAKEEADAKQVQMQKEIREEMERLRTQYTFKQHEMETSVRKPPWTARSKRTATEAPPTPLAVPAQMDHWNAQRDPRAAGPSKGEEEIPRGPRFGTIPKGSPKTVRNYKTASTPVAKKSAKLGFYNSFDVSTPVRPSQRMAGKAKDSRSAVQDETANWMGKAPSLFSQRIGRPSAGAPPLSPPSSPTRRGITVSDVHMPSDDYAAFPASDIGDRADVDMAYDDGSSEELEEIEGLNWKDELNRILLTHESAPSTSRTFQVLMKAHLDTSMSGVPAELYAKACSTILEVLAAHSTMCDWEAALSTSLTDMADILNTTATIIPLIALLDLLTYLSYSLPSFSSYLLSSPDRHSPAKILTTLFNIIRDHLSPSTPEPYHDQLASFTISLMESLCWNIPDDIEGQLALIPRSPGVLSILLDAAQPLSILSQSAHLLMVLSTRSSLFRSLLSFPDTDTTAHDYSKIPHIERLCHILVDANHCGPEAQKLKSSILNFFTMLAVAHGDAVTILLESPILVPSLVLYLSQLAVPIIEDEDDNYIPSKFQSLMLSIGRTLALLNYLVFNTERTFDLRHKLYHAPHRQFNGITHVFVVTFGALSYTDPPGWVEGEGRIEWDRVADLARDLLELIVEGPEGDTVYSAYQIEGTVMADEEEMEARLLEV